MQPLCKSAAAAATPARVVQSDDLIYPQPPPPQNPSSCFPSPTDRPQLPHFRPPARKKAFSRLSWWQRAVGGGEGELDGWMGGWVDGSWRRASAVSERFKINVSKKFRQQTKIKETPIPKNGKVGLDDGGRKLRWRCRTLWGLRLACACRAGLRVRVSEMEMRRSERRLAALQQAETAGCSLGPPKSCRRFCVRVLSLCVGHAQTPHLVPER